MNRYSAKKKRKGVTTPMILLFILLIAITIGMLIFLIWNLFTG